jgi:hypothetical protein
LRILIFNASTDLSSIPIFILGFVLISSSIPSFNQESFARCPSGSHKTLSGDCTEGLPTAEESAPPPVINASDLYNSNSEYLTYEGPLYGFKIDYPSETRPIESPNSVGFYLPHPQNADVSQVATLDIVPNIELQPGTTLDSFTRKLMAEAREAENANNYAENLTFSTISINRSKISHGTVDANMVFYEVKHNDLLGGYSTTYLKIAYINGGMGSELLFGIPTADFDKYIPIVIKMINSFELIGLT